jgi:hypothetical protein
MTGRPLCPHFPADSANASAASIAALGSNRGPAFYEASLQYGQVLWLRGLPGQALLQANRAMGADVSAHDEGLTRWPMPYAAVRWLLENFQPGDFIGNPRRHYQHLATRMLEPRKLQRSWRAWACWWISRIVLPEMPADEEQLEREGVEEPTPEQIYHGLTAGGLAGEADLWLSVVETAAALGR